MFGCGKFAENEMLLYTEGRSGIAGDIERHLMACASCLGDATELNRIGAEMDRDVPGGMKLPGFITIFSGIDKNSGKWNIARAIVSAASARWEPMTVTRGKESCNGRRTAVVTLDRVPVSVRISPAEPRAYWITLESESLRGITVELRRAGSELPVFSRKADTKELTIKNVDQGDYDLVLPDATVRVNLRETE
jgi:hypothetical protein